MGLARRPFPGLRPFNVDQHRVYFGRADEIKQLAELVRSAAEDAVLLVVGPSGCGKSSRFTELLSTVPESTMEQVDMALRAALNL